MVCRGSSPVLVGRTEQLAVLAEALADARQDGHLALLIGGEAGVGKSRLLAEFAATAPDARLLTARCLQAGEVLHDAHWPARIAELLAG